MQVTKFIVSYKYLDKSFEKKQISWALSYLKKTGNKYKIDFILNKKIKASVKNSIILINCKEKLKKNFEIKINLSKNTGSFAILPKRNKIIIYSNDYKGFIYGITEIIDIIKFSKNNKLIIKKKHN